MREVANLLDFTMACDLELEVRCNSGRAQRALRLEGRDEEVQIASPVHGHYSDGAALRDNERDLSHVR